MSEEKSRARHVFDLVDKEGLSFELAKRVAGFMADEGYDDLEAALRHLHLAALGSGDDALVDELDLAKQERDSARFEEMLAANPMDEEER